MVLGDISDALRIIAGIDSETGILQRDYQLACLPPADYEAQMPVYELSSQLERLVLILSCHCHSMSPISCGQPATLSALPCSEVDICTLCFYHGGKFMVGKGTRCPTTPLSVRRKFCIQLF